MCLWQFYWQDNTQFTVGGVIFANFVVVMISVTQWARELKDDKGELVVLHWCETADWCFIAFFLVELVVNMGVHACHEDDNKDYIFDWKMWRWEFWTGSNWKWNWFDFFVIIVPILAAAGWASGVRVLRLFRVVRMLKTVAKFDALLVIMNSVSRSMEGVGAVSLLMLMVVSMYSIIGVQLFGMDKANWDNEDCADTPLQKHFGNLRRGLLTMFQLVTVEGWPDLGWCLGKTYWFGSFFCVSFIILNALMMANIVVAIFTNQMEEAELEVTKMLDEKKKDQQAAVRVARARSVGKTFNDDTVIQGVDIDGDGVADIYTVDVDGDGIADITLDKDEMAQAEQQAMPGRHDDLSRGGPRWVVGAPIEVYSQTIKEWCPGKVLEVDKVNKKIRVEYDVNSNTLGEKTIPWTNPSIRHPANLQSQQMGAMGGGLSTDLTSMRNMSPEALTTMLASLTKRVEMLSDKVEQIINTAPGVEKGRQKGNRSADV